jgi:cytochrome c-type biogenesis protein CcmE
VRSYNPGVEAGSRRVPVRLIVSVAAVLAVFLLYTSFAGGATESLRPSQLMSGSFTGKEVQLAGIVTGPISGDSHAGGKRFKLKDFDGSETVDVVYTGTISELFKVGRHVYLRGTLTGGTFVGVEDSLVMKCPSKYSPAQDGSES